MGLPPRVYFTLHEVTARWGCNIADVAGWADAGRFRILTGIPALRCGDEVVAGKVVLSPMELLPLFRRCGTGPTEGVMHRIQPIGREDWLLITDPASGIPVAVADMLILAEEVHAFEEENETELGEWDEALLRDEIAGLLAEDCRQQADRSGRMGRGAAVGRTAGPDGR